MRLAITTLLFFATLLAITAPTVSAQSDCHNVRGTVVAHLGPPAATANAVIAERQGFAAGYLVRRT